MMVPMRETQGQSARELSEYKTRKALPTQEDADKLDSQVFKIRNEWLAAEMRVGDYPAGQVYLRTEDDEFCAIGVATEFAMMKGCPITRKKHPTEFYYVYTSLDSHEESYCGLLPTVAAWYGWTTKSPHAELKLTVEYKGRGYRDLSHMSDDKVPVWFIADVIEELSVK